MPERIANAYVHFDVLDQIELEQAGVSLVSDTVHADQAVEFGHQLLKEATVHTDMAFQLFNGPDKESQNRVMRAQQAANVLAAMSSKIFKVCPDEELAYIIDQNQN